MAAPLRAFLWSIANGYLWQETGTWLNISYHLSGQGGLTHFIDGAKVTWNVPQCFAFSCERHFCVDHISIWNVLWNVETPATSLPDCLHDFLGQGSHYQIMYLAGLFSGLKDSEQPTKMANTSCKYMLPFKNGIKKKYGTTIWKVCLTRLWDGNGKQQKYCIL